MATQKDAELSLTLDGEEFACQVINGTLTWPSRSEPTLVPVACGDKVAEPGTPSNGSISGEVYKDTSATGITRALITALEADATLAFIWTENVGGPVGSVLTVEGECVVSSHEQVFTPDTLGRHPLNLSVTSSTTTWA